MSRQRLVALAATLAILTAGYLLAWGIAELFHV